MNAGRKLISDIFNRDRILEIPFFQRAYVWEENQWERFLEDMKHISQNKAHYFFGSLILKQKPTTTDKSVGDVRTVIDGQQRLTTLILFFKVIALKSQEERKARMYKKFLLDSEPYPVALRHNHNDRVSFEKICALKELENFPSKNDEKDNILSAYQFFKKHIDVEELDVDEINNNLVFVGIDLDHDEDEQQIFDTINSLGVRLTTAELLKNYFFSSDELDIYEQNWKPVFEKDGEAKQYWDEEITVGRLRRTVIDLFFYAYLQIKVQELALKVSGKDKEIFSRVENLFQSYKTLIKKYYPSEEKGKKAIVGEIEKYANIFRKNFDHEIVKRGLTPEPGIERITAIIFRLETSTLIPYTLFILKNVENEEVRNDLFGSIESYVMRRMIVKETTKNYNQLFTDRMIGKRVLSKAEFQNQIQKYEDQVNFMPSDADLKEGFAVSKLTNKQTAGILYFIETVIGESSKNATRLWGISTYSLEHLMPKKWQYYWEFDASQEEKDLRNKTLLTLGNLAIIPQPLNSSIRNRDWETKKKGLGAGKEGLDYHASGLATLHDFLKVSDWNEREIEKRAEFLCEKAIKIWPAK